MMGPETYFSSLRFTAMLNHHIDDVVGIENVTSATPWSAGVFLSEIQSPTHVLLVGLANIDPQNRKEKVLGFTGGQIVGDELHIHSLAVNPEYWRNGIGRKLINELINEAISRDAKSATLEVRTTNTNAIALYEGFGFKVEGIREKYYADNGEDAQIMWLRNLEGIKQ